MAKLECDTGLRSALGGLSAAETRSEHTWGCVSDE